MPPNTVNVPESFEALFNDAENYVKNYFNSFAQAPDKGSITIGGERYILVRAASMSVHFLEHIKNMYPAMGERESIDASSRVLFDIAHTIGKNDAVAFHKATNVTDPLAKLSTGPVHFAYTGWAFVDILPDSKPSPDESYYLIYDHPHSFEADAWIAQDTKTDFCTCFMNSGYSTGWCEESFGLKLHTREILCRAKGDDYCRFIMAPSDKLDAYIEAYKEEHPDLFNH